MDAQRIELRIPSHPRFLQVVRGMVEKAAGLIDFGPDTTGHIILAVDEASSNIIRHSYLNDPSGLIDFTLVFTETRLEILITDYGQACDIQKMKPRDIDLVQPGGLGLYIINQVMDTVEFTCGVEGKNRIRMVKKR